MTFSEIVAETRRLVKATTASYSVEDITSSVNRALDRVVTLIRQTEGRWQWDDTNQVNAPYTSTTTITAGTNQYIIDPTYHRVERLNIKAPGATYFTKLMPFDISDPACLDMYNTASQGVPQYYDKMGNYFVLYPTPSYTQANSLQVFYERGPSYFTSADTTKAPGFNSLFHRLVSLWAAYDYAMINSIANVDRLRNEIALEEEKLQDFYAFRDKDESIRMGVRRRPWQFR